MEFKDLETTAKVVGTLTLDGPTTELKIMPVEKLLALDHLETAVVCCACYNPKHGTVYVGVGESQSHGDLKRAHDGKLHDTSNQEHLDSLIYGFVLNGGYFVNRLAMSKIVVEHHWQIAQSRYRHENEYFNSEMIQWFVAREKLWIMKRRKERNDKKQQEAASE